MIRWLPFILVFSAVSCVIYAADMRLHPRFFRWMASIPHLDKVLHFALMGLLAWVANIALGHHRLRLGSLRVLTGSLVILLIVAVIVANPKMEAPAINQFFKNGGGYGFTIENLRCVHGGRIGDMR